MGGGTVDGHQTKVNGGSQERHDQRAHREDDKIIAQHHAVEQCIPEERGPGRVH